MTTRVTPKQPQAERLKDWYPYYAGFTEAFVDDVLDAHFKEVRSLVDPWNGSGTTSAVAARRGLAALGVEINPAVAVIARGRLAPTTIADSLEPLASEICLAAKRDSAEELSDDPLSRWLCAPSVGTIRRLQGAIHKVLESAPASRTTASSDVGSEPHWPVLVAFYYSALFAATRDLLAPFRASNPTWMRYPPSPRHRLRPAEERIHEQFLQRVAFLRERLRVPSDSGAAGIDLRLGSVLDLDAGTQFDGCLTSPPYATRIDYVKSTLPELAVLGLTSKEVEQLRERTTGTPVVHGVKASQAALASAAAEVTVAAVREHPSHGSSSYYGPWIANYLRDLDASLGRLDSAVRKDGLIGLVVQDSHYKSVHIDLQTIIVEMLGARGRTLHCRNDFTVSHSMARMNPAARRHLPVRQNTESLLIFGSRPSYRRGSSDGPTAGAA